MRIDLLCNDATVHTDVAPGLLALDWLRERRRLTGTKEGCKEGDCGACSVLLAQIEPSGRVRVRPVTSCLVPMGELHGRAIITVEGLNLARALTPPQRAMVDEGGAQCGYCTPGFIVAMSWYVLYSDEPSPSVAGLREAISGNLCRCTGYGSIVRAAHRIVDRFAPGGDLDGVWQAADRPRALAERGVFPLWIADLPDRLTALHAELPTVAEPEPSPAPPIAVAGGTDLYVQRGEELPHVPVRVLNHRASWAYIRVDGDTVRIGSLTTMEDFAASPEIQRMIPSIRADMELIASLPIRHRATLAGNLINASPIGDMTSLLLALGATVAWVDGGGRLRTVPLEELYLGYKVLDRRPDELVAEIAFPVVGPDDAVAFEKVSKRRCLDIASVNSSARIRLDPATGTVTAARLSVGGVAPIPLLLRRASAALVGRVLDVDAVARMLAIADEEVAPIDDVRGSAPYKRLLARQLLLAHLTRLFPDRVPLHRVLPLVAPPGAAVPEPA
jgi:xanthine dehydrogenase small subunit